MEVKENKSSVGQIQEVEKDMINYLMDVCMPRYFWFLDTVLGTPSAHMSLVEWMVGYTDGCMDVWIGGQMAEWVGG